VLEAKAQLNEANGGASIDAALIVSIRRMQELELAGYVTAHAAAQELGYSGAANSLQQCIDEKASACNEFAEFVELSL
jgi:ferritin-like metal-binding protein YciE